MKIGLHTNGLSNKSSICIIMILLAFHVFSLSAQAPVFSVKVKFSVQQGGLENSLITITKNGAPYRVIDPSKSKYYIDLELGAEYLLTFTKLGHITKSIVIDTHVPNGREKDDFAKFVAEVGLAVQPEDQEITYSQPVGRIKYSGETGDFDYDKDYTATAKEMQKKAEDNPKPKPKPPTPNPRPTPPVTPTQTTAPSNPIPVVVKQPEYHPEPPKPKPVVTEPVVEQKPIVKNKVEKIIQEDRRKITIVIVTIDATNTEYRKEEYTWGGVYYYRDGKNITSNTYDKETE